MNNAEKLIASQYLIKQANLGALLRAAGRTGIGRFFKQNPIKATALTAGGALGSAGVAAGIAAARRGAALSDTAEAMAGNEPTFFKNMKDNPLVRGFREISNKNPLMADVIAAGNPFIGPAYFASKLKGGIKKVFGKPDQMIGGLSKYYPSKSPHLLGEAGIYRGPQDFKPGLRAPTSY